MYVDAQNLFFEDVDVATSNTSDVIDLGTNGAWVHPLYIDVKLTTPMTGTGKVTAITVQSAANKDFTTPADEITITPPAAVDQTKKAATIAQFYAPIRTGNRYVRLKTTASGSGGKLYASMVNGIKVDM